MLLKMITLAPLALRSHAKPALSRHAHYSAVALPCRIQDPDRKGKVESAVGHAQRTPPKRKRFESLEEAQAYLDRWEVHWADTRIHGTTKRQVAAMFAEEKPALLPLPLEPFRYYKFGKRKVHPDGCVEIDRLLQHTPGWNIVTSPRLGSSSCRLPSELAILGDCRRLMLVSNHFRCFYRLHDDP